MKGNTFRRDRRLKSNGLPPFLNSSGSSLVNYTYTLAAVRPCLHNKLADDTWILQDWLPSWKEGTNSKVTRHYGKRFMKRKIIGQIILPNFLFFLSTQNLFSACFSIFTALLFSDLNLNYFYNPLFKHFLKISRLCMMHFGLVT